MSKLEQYLTKQDVNSLKTMKQAIHQNQITVTCVGLYNHGKSTLLNVLIKDFKYKTFKTADARETTLNKAVIYNNIKYVDTPGLNAQKEDDKKVMEAVQNSDITLFVHTITTGEFNKKEIEFLNNIKQYWENPQEFIERTIFVLSRIDNIGNSEDVEKTSKRMKEQIKHIFDNDCLIIPISSTDYTEGMVENEEELISESNVKILEEKINFLSEQSKEAIIKTKRKRFEDKFDKLQLKLNKKLQFNQKKIKKLKEEQTKKDIELKNDLSKIENTLKSMYQRLEGI